MFNFAHRGYSGKFPENTMLAFKKAVEAGCDGIEFDVHLSKDGIPVIIHDETLNRTTSGKGEVGEYPLADLQKINAAENFKEIPFEPIPTLEEYFEYVQSKNIITNIELKTSIVYYQGIEEKVLKLIDRYKLRDKILISSFNHFSLKKMKELAPEIPCGALVDTWLIEPETYLKENGFEYYHPSCYGMDREKVKNLQEEGIGVNLWFGQFPFSLKKAVDMGADGIITDFTEELEELIREE